MTIREVSEEEYKAELKEEIERGCLLKAIHKRCDEINYLCSDLGYVLHREVQEQMVEIQDLIKAYMDMQKKESDTLKAIKQIKEKSDKIFLRDFDLERQLLREIFEVLEKGEENEQV